MEQNGSGNADDTPSLRADVMSGITGDASTADAFKDAPKESGGVIGVPKGLAALQAMYGSDREKEENGAVMTISPRIWFKVRSQQSMKAREVSKQLMAELQPQMATGVPMTPAQEDAFNIELCARALFVDWGGADMEGMACTDANVRQTMGLQHLRRAVLGFTVSLENYR